jgi:hypothetical protein
MLREARDRELTRRAQAINDELIAQARNRVAAANERNSELPTESERVAAPGPSRRRLELDLA